MRSLQRRAILGGLLWAVSAVLIGGFALVYIFDSLASRRFDAELQDRHLRVLAALGNVESADQVANFLTDPAYSRPYSGSYWQLDGNGETETSPSMFDVQFELPASVPAELHFWSGPGPQSAVRGVRETITLDNGSVWIVTVAESLDGLNTERLAMRQSVAIAFGAVGLFMILGAVALTSAVVRPIRELVLGICAAAGVQAAPRDVPFRVARRLGGVVDSVWPHLGREDEPPLTRFLAEQLGTAHWFDPRPARDDLGWQPTVSIDEGLERLADWYRSQGDG